MHTYIDIYTLTPTLESHIYMYTYIYIHKYISIHIFTYTRTRTHLSSIWQRSVTREASIRSPRVSCSALFREVSRSATLACHTCRWVILYIKKRHISQTLAFLALCFSERECVAYVMSLVNIAVSMSQCVAVCCSVLQCVAVCCSVLHMSCHLWTLQLVCRNVLQCVAVCCSVLQCAAVCCSVLQCVAYVMSHMNIAVSMSQCVATCCSVLQCAAVCCICHVTYEHCS